MNKEPTLIRLVDDDESLLFSTKILLEALGWKVAAYNSPTEFLVRDNLSIPGCAVLDVRMPQMTGLEVQEMLIERGFAHFPLIFLSGHGDIQMAVNAMSKGALTFPRSHPCSRAGHQTSGRSQRIKCIKTPLSAAHHPRERSAVSGRRGADQ